MIQKYYSTVAAQIRSKTDHEILHSPVQLQYASPPKEDVSLKSESRLVIPELPNEIELFRLEVFLEGRVDMSVNEDFTLEKAGPSVVITFCEHKSHSGETEITFIANNCSACRAGNYQG